MTSIQKKILNGVTGLGLVLFVIMHLAGNLTLFSSNPDIFNAYAKRLHDLGIVLYIAEIGLLAFFIFHIISGVTVYFSKKRARSTNYAVNAYAGNPSRKSVSSVSMIYTGGLIMLFVIWHIITFKYGPGIEQGYVTTIGGEQARDLYRLVYEYFASPLHVLIYVTIMLLLGLHLRHGFWSVFQTLSINNPKYSSMIYSAALAIASLLAVGFLLIPVWIYFSVNGGF